MHRKGIRDVSIRTKLSILLVGSVGAVLILCCVFFAFREIQNLNETMTSRLRTLASVLGHNSAAALRFQYASDAVQILSTLQHQPSVVGARLYDEDGLPFASYPEEGETFPPTAPALSHHVHGEFLDVYVPIIENNERLGSILVRASMKEAYQRQREIIRIAALSLAALLVVSYFLARWLQRVISDPILHLVHTTNEVAKNNDYSIRAQKTTNDETGLLTDAINEMLNQIQKHREHLEELVIERTLDLEAKTREAQAANMAKTEFLANMSHEIRTPMTAILGFAEVLLQDPHVHRTIPDHIVDLQTIKRNGEHLIEIINDILDISKIEAGRFEVEAVSFSPWQVIVDVVSLMRVRTEAKGLRLHLRGDGPLPETIQSDPTRLRQILINLIGNAVKFTEVGEVGLTVRFLPDTDYPKLQISVSDTGLGMTPEHLTKLFRPFSQADTSTTRRFGGTGLGLVISKRLTEMLGGTIEVESEYKKGSTFTVTLATGAVKGVALIDSPSESIHSEEGHPLSADDVHLDCRILLAEDGPDNQRLITFHLRKAGAQVEIAENGQAAVAKVLRSMETGNEYDLVLMDMQMPVLDGYAATTQLRRNGYEGPIIALTAHAMAGDRDKCLAAGCNEYASKPIDRRSLIQTIHRQLTSTREMNTFD